MMHRKRPFLLLVVLFLASYASCDLSFDPKLGRVARQVLRQTREHYTAKLWRKEATLVRQKNEAVTGKAEGILCSWDEDQATCDTSLQTVASYLAESNNAFAQFVSQFTTCEAAKSKKSCKSSGHCTWDRSEKRCYFVEISFGHEDSPCYVAAPGFVDLIAYSPVCEAMSTQHACGKHPRCQWDEDDRQCGLDLFKALCGLSRMKFDTAILRIRHDLLFYIADLTRSIDFDDPDFDDWSSILTWVPSKRQCPKGIDPQMWEIAQAFMRELMPIIMYCTVRYHEPEDMEGCEVDPFCEHDAFSRECLPSLTEYEASALFFESVTPYVEAKLDKRIMKVFGKCGLIRKEKKCRGSCVWMPEKAICSVKADWIVRRISAAGKSGKDVLCKYLALEADSGCVNHYSYETCTAKRRCMWRALDKSCLPTVKYLLKAGGEGKPDEDSSLGSLQSPCHAQVTKSDCLGVGQMVKRAQMK